MTADSGLHRATDIEGDLARLADRLCVGKPVKRDMVADTQVSGLNIQMHGCDTYLKWSRQ